MTGLNRLVLEKIDSMNIPDARKKTIKKMFDIQWRIGSDRNTKNERVNAFYNSLAEGADNEDN